MGIYRTYLSKNNTIIKGKLTNTGQNPVSELFFGGAHISGGTSFTGGSVYSRYLFSFSTSAITDLYSTKQVLSGTSNQVSSHKLKMTNTGFFDRQLLGDKTIGGRLRSSSFDLVLFLIPTGQTWDEGVGYDFDYGSDVLIDVNPTIIDASSNWYTNTSTSNWNQQGVYSSVTTANTAYFPLKTQHFDLGNENIDMDITNIFETIRTGGTLTSLDGKTMSVNTSNFQGLGIAYSASTENSNEDRLFTVAFFTRYTNSFYEPYIETTWNQQIKDDRADFYLDKSNRLFLYTHVNKEPTNLDQLPTAVTITDYSDIVYTTITSTTNIRQMAKGVYYVDLEISSALYPDLVTFTDTWKGLKISGRTLPNATMNFTLKENKYFNLGDEVYEPDNFIFGFGGIRRGDKIIKGDNRKITVEVRPYYTNDKVVIDNLYYRVFTKQGEEQIDIIPKTEIFRTTNQNYFYLDTSWLIPQEYKIELTIVSNGATITKNGDDLITFTVIDNETQN